MAKNAGKVREFCQSGKVGTLTRPRDLWNTKICLDVLYMLGCKLNGNYRASYQSDLSLLDIFFLIVL